MTTQKLGKLEPVPLRTIWPHEERNFTPWLAENLHLLSEVLDLNLELIDTESTLPYAGRVDILAKDKDNDANVIIENQLENSDDDHFARLIGYAASRDARTLIWVAGGFWEWHRRMLDWLNEENGIDAYGVEVRAWRIGDAFAPDLRCVARPTSRAKRKSDASVSTTTAYAHFYGPVVEQLRKAGMPPMGKGGWRGRWRSFPTGYEHIVYALRLDNGEASAFLDASGDAALPVYRSLCEYQPQIDAEMGNSELEWHEDESESWIAIRTAASLEDTEEELEATRKWMFNNLLKLRDTIQPYLNEVMSKLQTNVTPAPNATELDQ